MIRRGTIQAFDAVTFTATVQIEGSDAGYVAGVPVNRGIAAADVIVGRAAAVAVYDDNNPTDAMVVGVW